MPTNWMIKTIAECASNEPYSTQIGPFGEKIRAQNYTATGAPVLRGTNVNPDGRFHDDDFVYIDSELAESEFSKFVCEADDVILCHKGTLGKIGIIPKNSRYKKYIMGNSMMKVRCNKSILDPLFLYYWLCSQDGQNYLFSRVSQVGVPQIQQPLTTLRDAQIPIPPIDEQRTIAQILGALDDKIELNRRMNETLEAMARAIFKSWFVDFDPVRAKAEGRQPYGMDAETAALFPDGFEDSVLGEVPRGWRVGPISDCCLKIQNGGTPRRDEPAYWQSGHIPWLTSGEVRQSIITATENFITDAGLENSSAKWISSYSTVVALYGATAGQVSFTALDLTTNQAVCSLVPQENSAFFNYIAMRESTSDMQNKAVGSAQQNISKGIVESTVVVLPPKQVIKHFHDHVNEVFGKWIANLHESKTLMSLRDTLLPKMLNGDCWPIV